MTVHYVYDDITKKSYEVITVLKHCKLQKYKKKSKFGKLRFFDFLFKIRHTWF